MCCRRRKDIYTGWGTSKERNTSGVCVRCYYRFILNVRIVKNKSGNGNTNILDVPFNVLHNAEFFLHILETDL